MTERIRGLDLFRGLVLAYMGFVNAFFAVSKEQPYLLSHDGPLMGPGDLIAVFFFLSIGFNLALVRYYRYSSNHDTLKYAVKRAVLVVLAGIITESYVFFIAGFAPVILFRSFLVLLGASLFLTALVIVILRDRMENWYKLVAACAVILLLYPLEMPRGYRFLNPFLLLSSLGGYIFGYRYVYRQGKFYTGALIAVMLLSGAGIARWLIYSEPPSRHAMNPSYFFISWAVIIILMVPFMRMDEDNAGTSRRTAWLVRLGQHPLAFWIVQSFVVAGAVLAVSVMSLLREGAFTWTWNIPLMVQAVEPLWLAASVSAGMAFLSALATIGISYLPPFRRKRI